MNHPDHYYEKHEEPNQSCLLALRKVILASNNDINESIKWGIPCFMKGKRIFCFLSIHKKSNVPYILWVDGTELEHPLLEQGDRKRMKILRFDPTKDLPKKTLQELLNEALQLASKPFRLKKG